MSDIRLLDCTLRDGGYVNDWKFGHDSLVGIFERLVDANVDIIEIGFLDDRRPFDIDRSIMPNTACAEKIWKDVEHKNVMVVGMIDYGTCDISNIQPCCDSFLDGIRVIFKEHLMKEAMEYCRQIKELGYKVFAQLVSVTTYTKESMLELIELVNDIIYNELCLGVISNESKQQYLDIIGDLVKSGVQGVILGCTEIGLLVK